MRQRRHIEPHFAQRRRPLGVIAPLGQVSDDIHAAIDMLESQRQLRCFEELEKQRLPRSVLAAAPADVRVKRAALEEERERRLIDERQMIVAEMFELDETIEQLVRHDDVA